MTSAERNDEFTEAQRDALLSVAHDSIEQGLRAGRPLDVGPQDYCPALQAPGASFVTLRLGEDLRGCIGSIRAERPLVSDVALNAYAAAFREPRFAKLTWPEFESLNMEISVLSPPEPVSCSSEADLIARLRPGIDGVILHNGDRRSTLLPAAWRQIPFPIDFLKLLKAKAGLPADYWSEDLRFSSYTTESFRRAKP